jgi:hypothetical protein
MFGGFCNLLGLSFKGRNYEYAFLPRSGLLEQIAQPNRNNHAVLRKSQCNLESSEAGRLAQSLSQNHFLLLDSDACIMHIGAYENDTKHR